MMKIMSYFNVSFTDIKIANDFHHQVQALNMNFNPYIDKIVHEYSCTVESTKQVKEKPPWCRG